MVCDYTADSSSASASIAGHRAAAAPSPDVADELIDLQGSHEVLDDEVWQKALKADIPVLRQVPQPLRTVVASAKGQHLVAAVHAMESDDDQQRLQAWWQVLLFDKLICHTGGDKDEGINAKTRQRLRWLEDCEWLQLVSELCCADGGRARRQTNQTSDKIRVQRVVRNARTGSWRRALSAVLQDMSAAK